jgi:hypothetical protein
VKQGGVLVWHKFVLLHSNSLVDCGYAATTRGVIAYRPSYIEFMVKFVISASRLYGSP